MKYTPNKEKTNNNLREEINKILSYKARLL